MEVTKMPDIAVIVGMREVLLSVDHKANNLWLIDGSIIREAVIGAATAPNYNHEFKPGYIYEQIVYRRLGIM
jgi:hypothetical protein